MLIRIVIIGCLITIACGCEQAPPRTDNPQRPGLAVLPIEMLVKQRTTTSVPGSDYRLFLTIDDITHNQVMASLSAEKSTSILPPISMEPTDSSQFQFGGTEYRLTLRQLDNALVGENVATFVVSASSKILNGEAQIEDLISSVAALVDATFVRNGVEYSAVESVGSKSLMSGEPYMIELPDGEIMSAEEFLREQLKKLKSLD